MVYLVTRCQYEHPVGNYVIQFEDESLIKWLRRNWLSPLKQEQLLELAKVDSVDDFNPHSIRESFHEIAIKDIFRLDHYNVTEFVAHMMGHTRPESYEDLAEFIDSFDECYGEGKISFSEHAIEIDSNDGETDYTWHLFDSEFAEQNPGRTAFLLREEWQLPEEFSDTGLNPSFQTASFADLPQDGPMTYCCFLSAMDDETIGDLDGCFRIQERLPNCLDWLAEQTVEPQKNRYDGDQHYWHENFLLLRSLAKSPTTNSFQELLEAFDLTDDMFRGWLPRTLSDFRPGHEDELFFAKDSYQSCRTDLTKLIKASERSVKTENRFDYQKRPSLFQFSEHMAQVVFTKGSLDFEDETLKGTCQRWIFFDDLWAAANPDLAESILRYGRAGDARSLLNFFRVARNPPINITLKLCGFKYKVISEMGRAKFIRLSIFVAAALFPLFGSAEVHFNLRSVPGPGKVDMTLWMVETTSSIADAFEKNLRVARNTGNIKKSKDAMQMLDGMTQSDELAKNLGKFVFHNINARTYEAENGKTIEIAGVDYVFGLKASISCNVRLDHTADVTLNVDYLKEGEGRSIEKSRTMAAGTTRMQSGWPKLVFRWDQFYHSRLLILTMGQAPPTSRQRVRHGESTLMQFTVIRTQTDSSKRSRYPGFPAYRATEEEDWMTRFTADVFDGKINSFADNYLLAQNERRALGYPILTTESTTEILFPWQNSRSTEPILTAQVQFYEPTGRYTEPPFTSGRFPDSHEVLLHNFELKESPLNFREAFSIEDSNYILQLYTHILNEPQPQK